MKLHITRPTNLPLGCRETFPFTKKRKEPTPNFFSSLLTAKLMTLFLMFGILFTPGKSYSQSKNPIMSKTTTTIVFVHGLWADGSSWSKVAALLLEKGYNIITVQNPTTSIEDDVAATQRAIERADGDVILVGHSWGGFVISEAGNHSKVKALVYVAAYVPDTGETIPTVSEKAAGTNVRSYLQSIGGYLTLTKEGVQKAFANDLPAKEQELVYAVQQPAFPKVFEAVGTNTAWRQKPSWYIVASEDNTIHPELEKMMAARAKSKTTILKSSHVAMLSKPKEVSEVILDAVAQVSK
jgi:pimeloyl-ACP methyl ester carboxylesterase